MIYGLIGESLKHSYSKQIHDFLGNEQYELNEIKPENLDDFMTRKEFKGINVTIPYKEQVMKYCVLSPQAEKIGSVNTVVNRDGILYGYNTDYFGFLEMTKKKGITFCDEKVIILGTGGTAKTVRAVAEDEGAREIVNISRNGSCTYEDISYHYDGTIIVNTTPVGMFPNNEGCPIDASPFKNLKAMVDVIYNPLKTKFLLQREDVVLASGLPMLVGQALYAHNLFFNVNEEERLDEVVNYATSIFSNIILIGMPGSGKSTVGKKLAKKLSMKFADTDDVILEVEGRSPKEIIESDGELAFREIEARIISSICKEGGQVIATGGGSVLLEENRQVMKQNGKIFWLDRDISKLSTAGRPLSKNVEKLFEVRKPIYDELKDYKISVRKSPNYIADCIIKLM